MSDMSAASTQPTDSYEGAGQSGDPISGLNPEDIESISVLSGPSAAALYGSAAAPAVVTTHFCLPISILKFGQDKRSGESRIIGYAD